MKNGKYGKDRGFSLIELIIAIAILVILTGILAPQFLKHIEKSRKAVCDSNIETIQKQYNVYCIETENSLNTDAEIIAAANQVITDSKAKCPSGGTYSAEVNALKWPVVFCSVHGKVEKKIEKDIFDNMAQLQGKTKKELEELLKKNPSNDNLREYIREKMYGGTWPVLTADFLKKYGLEGETYYIQPYLNLKSGVGNTSDITIFANKSQGNNWKTSLVYDIDEGQWYLAPMNAYGTVRTDISINDKSWTDIKKEITDSGWEAIK